MKKEVEGNIDSSPDSEGDNVCEFEERSASATVYTPPAEASPPLRRSSGVSKPPLRYGFNLLSQALITQEIPVSFRSATSPDNIDFWQAGIDREHDCLLRNKT